MRALQKGLALQNRPCRQGIGKETGNVARGGMDQVKLLSGDVSYYMY